MKRIAACFVALLVLFAGHVWAAETQYDGTLVPTVHDKWSIGRDGLSSQYIYLVDGLVIEGATENAYETTLAFTDPTADRTITFPNATGTVQLGSAEGAANGIWHGTNAVVFEGATANDYETSIVPTDPTADRTVTLPNATGAVILSAGGVADAANAISGGTGTLIWEGSSADGFETTVGVTNPTADRTFTLPDASGIPILSATVPEGAHGIWGGNSQLVFEGATTNAFETIVAVTDPTADRTITLADASGVPILSSALPDAANAVSGVSNGLVWEGATANSYEATLTTEDPTTDNTHTLVDYSSGIAGVISQSDTATAVTNTTTAITGSALSIASGWLTDNKTIHWIGSGTSAGGNSPITLSLYLENADIISLSNASAGTGDFFYDFWLIEYTDTAHQKCIGRALFEGGTELKCDYDVDTTNFAQGAGTPVTVSIRATSRHASDVVTNEWVSVETYTK